MEPYPLENTIFSPTIFTNTSVIEFSPRLSMQRYITVLQVIKDFHERQSISSITEFGCGSFVFFDRYLVKCDFLNLVNQIDLDKDRLIGALHMIKNNQFMKRNDNPNREPLKINIFEGNVGQEDSRVIGDVVVAIEVIEHLFEKDLSMFPTTIFNFLKPKLVIVTTPNYDYNILFNDNGKLRDEDHKFEFTKTQFKNWGTDIISKYPDYRVRYYGIGALPLGCSTDIGFCTQMAIFEKCDMSQALPTNSCIQNYNFIGSFVYFGLVDDRTEDQKLLEYIDQLVIKYTIDDEHLLYIVNEKCVFKHQWECLPLNLLISNNCKFKLDETDLITFMSKYENRFCIKYFNAYGRVLVIKDECEMSHCDDFT